jgi:hypothetical protein
MHYARFGCRDHRGVKKGNVYSIVQEVKRTPARYVKAVVGATADGPVRRNERNKVTQVIGQE